MPAPKTAYGVLVERFAKVDAVEDALKTLKYDTDHFLSANSIPVREKQVAALERVVYSMLQDPDPSLWFQSANMSKATLSEDEQRNLERMEDKWLFDRPLLATSLGLDKEPEPKTAYEHLKERFELIHHVDGASGILYYDANVLMQDKSAEIGKQREALALASYALLTAPEVGQWLDSAERTKGALAPEDQRNLQLMRRDWQNTTVLSPEMVQETTYIESYGEELHTRLRASGDWGQMKDWYKHSFNAMRSVGEARQQGLGLGSPYEGLMSIYLSDVTAADVAREFAVLEQNIPALIAETVKKQEQDEKPIALKGPFPREQQEELVMRLAAAMGFDFTRGRLDVLDMHPFTGGASGDTRLTSDYKEDNFLEAVYSAVHETGHALYDQNTPEEWRGQPAGRTMLMNVHESQSRIMEVQAARTPEFFEFLSKTAQEVFNRPNDESLSAANLAKLVNRAKPSFIRIEADALTYTAHILLRRDLESAIIENKLSVDDLPGKWNGGMQKLLGITPANPAEGHMQDGHWPSGAIGYFPAYTLGDMMAAQLFAAATKQKPEIRDGLKTGDFKPLRDWLKDNVHGKGSLLTVDELMTQATGEKLNAKYYLDNLSRQYLGKSWTPAAVPGMQAAATLG